MAAPPHVPAFKVVLVGDSGVGKSAFLRRVVDGSFDDDSAASPRPTVGAEVHPLHFTTNHGALDLHVWDTAGLDKYAGLRSGYYIQADAAVIMYDVTSRASYESVARWRRDLLDACGPGLRIALVGNKAAAADGERQVRHVYCATAPPQPEAVAAINEDEKEAQEWAADADGDGAPAPPSAAELAAVRALPFFEVSARENRSMTRGRSLHHPLLHLARTLTRIADLQFLPAGPAPAAAAGRGASSGGDAAGGDAAGSDASGGDAFSGVAPASAVL